MMDTARHRQRAWSKNELFHVRFGFDRTPFRRMHAALWAAAQPPVLRLLLPPKGHGHVGAFRMVCWCHLVLCGLRSSRSCSCRSDMMTCVT